MGFFINSTETGVGSIAHSSLTGLSGDDHTQYSLISSGSGAPGTTPSRVGEIYVDTVGNNTYISTGTSSSADWTATGGSGETNTASNTGTVGTGVFKQKTASDLEFYKLNTQNDRLSIALNGTDRIDFTINESNIDLTNVSGYVANEHIDWTSTTSNFSTSGSITGTGVVDFGGATSLEIPNSATPTVNAAGEIALDTTVTDYTGMLKYYDGTEELTVVAMPTANLVSTDGYAVVYNATNNEFEMADRADTDTFTTIQVDGTPVSTNAPTLDFNGTDFSVSESPTDDFDITIQVERIQDIAGAMWTGNTETGCTVTYQDIDGTMDITVSDLTVAGDTGSTGMTPGDTLTIAGGSHTTTAMSGDTLTINTDGDFLLNTGDSGTGDYDFTGADSFALPTAAAPVVNANGEIAVDTTVTDFSHGLLKYYSGEELGVVAMPIAEYTSPTDGDVITYDAAADEFTMAQPAGGGGLVLLSTATASSSATIDFDNVFDSTYDTYILVFNKCTPATDSVELYIRVGTGATPTYQAGVSDYSWATHYFTTSNSGTSDSADSEWSLYTGGGWGSAASEHGSGLIYIHDPADTSTHTYMHASYATERYDGALVEGRSAGRYHANTAVTSLRLLFASGNVESGEFFLYGMVKT